MRVYLASRFGRWPEMQEYEKDLIERGHTVTSYWHNADHLKANAHVDLTPTREQRLDWASRDMVDILACSTLISFTEAPRGDSRGGRHVEYGAALALEKETIVIGPLEHIFHELADTQFDTWEEYLGWLDAQ